MDTTSLFSILHLATAVAALATGAVVLLAAKGTSFHKTTGYAFALSLLLTNLSAACLYNLTGAFNFLHVFIIISLFSLAYGLWPAVRRRSPGWYSQHVRGMTGAALGVWAAGFTELTIRVLPGIISPQQIIWFAIGMGVVFFFLIGFAIHQFSKPPVES
jgi:uncharacterized membrane protein